MKVKFCVFIISHGRANNVITYKTLRKCGYSGAIKIIIDDEDKQQREYRKNFSDSVIVFNKSNIAKTTDNGDNFRNYRSTTHARNACFGIAKQLEIESFLVLDDDYTAFRYKFNDLFQYKDSKCTNLDQIFLSMLKFLNNTNTLSICFSQTGDFIGGGEGKKIILKRKAMNSFFCLTDRPFKFISRLNEDVNTYLTLGNIGKLFFTTFQFCLQQKQTQTNAGGMSDAYISSGTYVKSFYSVMYLPSAVKIYQIGSSNKRIHHHINWGFAAPKIISEQCKKT